MYYMGMDIDIFNIIYAIKAIQEAFIKEGTFGMLYAKVYIWYVQGWVSSGRNLFLPGQWKKHGFFHIFPLSSGRNGRMGSMIKIEKAMGYE